MTLTGEGGNGGGDLGDGGMEVAAGDRWWGVAGEGLSNGVASEASDCGDGGVAQTCAETGVRSAQSRQDRARPKIVSYRRADIARPSLVRNTAPSSDDSGARRPAWRARSAIRVGEIGCSRSLSPFSRSHTVDRRPSRSRRRRFSAPSRRAPDSRWNRMRSRSRSGSWLVVRTASMSSASSSSSRARRRPRTRRGLLSAYPDHVSLVPDEVLAELVAEFGDGAPAVAERALRAEITRHRISVAIKRGDDPAADALARDPHFLTETDIITGQAHPSSNLDERLRRWG